VLLFESADDPLPARVIPLERDFHFWHAFVPELAPARPYALRPSGASGGAFRFDRDKVLLANPYGPVGAAPASWDRTARRFRRQRGELSPPRRRRHGGLRLGGRPAALSSARGEIIYELTSAGFTRSPSAEVARPGTFRGSREKIPYLVTWASRGRVLPPSSKFDSSDGDYWGYNRSLTSATHDRYGTLEEFATSVKALHRAGIEGHPRLRLSTTPARPAADGPTISLRRTRQRGYYMLSTDGRLLAFHRLRQHPRRQRPDHVERWVFDCLCYWVEERTSTAFASTEGTVLTRGPDGACHAVPAARRADELADQLGETK